MYIQLNMRNSLRRQGKVYKGRLGGLYTKVKSKFGKHRKVYIGAGLAMGTILISGGFAYKTTRSSQAVASKKRRQDEAVITVLSKRRADLQDQIIIRKRLQDIAKRSAKQRQAKQRKRAALDATLKKKLAKARATIKQRRTLWDNYILAVQKEGHRSAKAQKLLSQYHDITPIKHNV